MHCCVYHMPHHAAPGWLERLPQCDVHNEDADLYDQGKGIQAEDILHAQLLLLYQAEDQGSGCLI